MFLLLVYNAQSTHTHVMCVTLYNSAYMTQRTIQLEWFAKRLLTRNTILKARKHDEVWPQSFISLSRAHALFLWVVKHNPCRLSASDAVISDILISLAITEESRPTNETLLKQSVSTALPIQLHSARCYRNSSPLTLSPCWDTLRAGGCCPLEGKRVQIRKEQTAGLVD